MNNKERSALELEINNRLNRLNYKFEIENSIKKVLLGKLLAKLNQDSVKSFHEAEFRVFSQFGDDGIIQYLIGQLPIQDCRFIEFGVENYNESNTRFLLENNNWQGLVIDGSEKNIQYIRSTENYWRHSLTALCRFVTAENINQIIFEAGFSGSVGLLSIDIDGNDYWIWQAISVVQPTIVIIEYNSLFGIERCITVPYKPDFMRFHEHYSGLYAGCSLPALCELAEEKGYALVGCNSAGNNAYFVRKDQLGSLTERSFKDGYVLAKFREHRDEQGQMTFMPGFEAVECLRGMPVFNTQSLQIEIF